MGVTQVRPSERLHPRYIHRQHSPLRPLRTMCVWSHWGGAGYLSKLFVLEFPPTPYYNPYKGE
jgi:hypothetical protein